LLRLVALFTPRSPVKLPFLIPPQRLLLLVILIVALTMRLIGINWDQGSHMHPDERFLTTIAGAIGKPENLTTAARERCPDQARPFAYFDTQCSFYNPNNISEGSYVYGTLPLFLVNVTARGAAAINLGGIDNPSLWLGYDYIHLVGRFISALADTFSVLMLYLIGKRLFSRNHGLLAAAFYAFAVLPIQLSHYWTVDAQSHLYVLLALYGAIEIGKEGRFWGYALYGIALAAALASRINLYPLAGVLPLVLVLRYWLGWYEHREAGVAALYRQTVRRKLVEDGLLSLFCVALALIAFRVFQPYAFIGPSINDWTFDPEWWRELVSVSDLSRLPSEGWPPSVQWFGRMPFVYPWTQMVLWGMGIALGVAATLALVVSIVHQLRNHRPVFALALLVVWALAYFVTTGGIHQMTMRYYLPIYGALILLATWGIYALPPRLSSPALLATVGITGLWSIAFLNIYLQPFTRVEASRWMESNALATITFADDSGALNRARIPNYHFSAPMQPALRGESYLGEPFTLASGQALLGIEINFTDDRPTRTRIQLMTGDQTQPQNILYETTLVGDDANPASFVLNTQDFVTLQPGLYRWHISNEWEGGDDMRQFIAVSVVRETGDVIRRLPALFLSPYQRTPFIPLNSEASMDVTLDETSTATRLLIPHMLNPVNELTLTLNGETVRAILSESSDTALGDRVAYVLERPLALTIGTPITVRSGQPTYITGTAIATEGAWDDGLPLLYCEYLPNDNAFSNLVGGLAQYCQTHHGYSRGWFVDLPLNMAETDSEMKMRRMEDILGKADFLIISSNRFYDAQVRVPTRFATSMRYYDALFAGELGYTLEHTAVRYPSLLGINILHQSLPTSDNPRWMNELEAEEAFTVYDHPTVFIFRNQGFDAAAFPEYAPFVVGQRSYIDLEALPDATYNLSVQPISDGEVTNSLVGWVVLFMLLGWVSYPVVYSLFPGLPLRGFAIGRGLLWLLFAFIAWYATSLGVGMFWTQQGLWLLVGAWVVINAVVFFVKRRALLPYIRENGRAFLLAELLFVGVLMLGLMLRAVNPDLWNVGRGGEKPMDFAYLNAVLRTPVFPPPNPWMANFEINYYYFGFVISALPIKLTGVASEVGYNLAMGTLYAVIFMILYVASHTLLPPMRAVMKAMLAFVGAILAMIAGNLGTLQLLLAPEQNMDPHRWYWYPTRVLGESANRAGGAINEIPLFSFLFGDLHAHVIALLPTSLMLLTMIVMVRTKRIWTFALLGALSGMILMTNTWDVLMYVPLGALAVWLASRNLAKFVRNGVIVSAAGIITIAPFFLNFSSGAANGVDWWNGERSLIEPWLLVWGIPLGIAFIWLMHRARAAFFPEVKAPLELGIVGVLLIAILAPVPSVATSVVCVLLIVLAALLAWRDDAQHRFVHVSIAIAVGVLLAIEYVVVRNDVGRMNTVFKLSYQLWVWLALTVPIILFRLFESRKRVLASISLLLIGMGALYPVYAIPGRANESFSPDITLDGNRFLRYITIPTQNGVIDALEDADLIYYMRRELRGFPIIAEWYTAEYQWNSRIAVQTGLPSVVGWANHMRQQYSDMVPLIEERIRDMQILYTTTDRAQVEQIIRKYGIDYIVMGKLEQRSGNPLTFAIFALMASEGDLEIVHRYGDTTLYEVTLSG
jgi:YYY domain-containing protein